MPKSQVFIFANMERTPTNYLRRAYANSPKHTIDQPTG